jgi:hypothetical protein
MFVTPLLPPLPQQPPACAAVPLNAVMIATSAMCRIDTLIVGLPELSKPITQLRRQFLLVSASHFETSESTQTWHVTCGCNPEVQKSGYQGRK